MPHYANHYVVRPDADALSDQPQKQLDLIKTLKDQGVDIHESQFICGTPRICYTHVSDEHIEPLLTMNQAKENGFFNAISIDEGCYIESTLNAAFHSGCTKLSVIKRNNVPVGKITIGKSVQLQGTALIAYEQITVENDVTFGPGVTVMDSSGHALLNRKNHDEASRISSSPVHIKEHAWLGLGVTVLKGVTIGKHAVVGAQSVVYEDVPDYAVVMGNPAVVVKHLDPDFVKQL